MGRKKKDIVEKSKTKLKVSGERRGATISCKYLTGEELALKNRLDEENFDSNKPTTREECKNNGVRPCPYVSCKYHLYLNVNKNNGSIKFNFPDLEFDDLEETCALDIIEKGEATLDMIGQYMNLTRERVRQIEDKVLQKLHKRSFSKEVLEYFGIYN